jgi:hypothetical protein
MKKILFFGCLILTASAFGCGDDTKKDSYSQISGTNLKVFSSTFNSYSDVSDASIDTVSSSEVSSSFEKVLKSPEFNVVSLCNTIRQSNISDPMRSAISGTISYTNTNSTASAKGSYSYDESTGVIKVTETITLTNFSATYLDSDNVSHNVITTGSSTFSVSLKLSDSTGTMTSVDSSTVTFDGTNYSLSSNCTFTVGTGTITSTGTATVNNVTYSVTGNWE